MISAGSMLPDSRSRCLARVREVHHIGAPACLVPKALSEHFGDIGFVVDHEDADTHDAASVITGR